MAGRTRLGAVRYARKFATDFVVYTVKWLPDRVVWYIDDLGGNPILVRSETGVVPDEAMNPHFNIHVPDPSWTEAYDPTLQPVANALDNLTYYLEVDWVEVTQVPEPKTLTLAALGLASMTAVRRSRKRVGDAIDVTSSQT